MSHVLSAVDPASPATARFDFQLRMLERGAGEVQAQIARLDDVLFKLKASFVTIWIAVIGWSATIGRNDLLPLTLIVVLAFWMLEGVFRAAQIRFVDRARRITALLNDRGELDRCFERRELPADVIFPVSFRETEFTQLRYYVRGLTSPTVATLHLFIGLVSYLVWVAQPFGS